MIYRDEINQIKSNKTPLDYKSEALSAWYITFNKNYLHSMKIKLDNKQKKKNLTC
jgi:hypothetical protein